MEVIDLEEPVDNPWLDGVHHYKVLTHFPRQFATV
jgi:hypothetical protein